MQMFNTTTAEALFIKNILKNTYLPILPTISDGEYMVQGANYIYKNNILKCKTSGIFSHDPKYVVDGNFSSLILTCSDTILCGNSLICGEGSRMASFNIEGTFIPNKHSPGINSAYISNTDVYDIDTHIHLGNYLRWYRDTKNINLMPLYNCFAGEDTQLFHIENNMFINKSSSKYTTWVVKAQLNKKYTIYIDSDSQVSIGGSFLNHFGRVKYQNSSSKRFMDETMINNIKTYHNTDYNHPLYYSTFTDNPEMLAYNNNFYLVIQTHNSQPPSIVVLEGDYRKTPNRQVTSIESLKNIDYDTEYDKFNPIIKPSLTTVPSKYVIPYAPRLIEFLTESVITSEETIPQNIGRIQRQLGIYNKENTHRDIWDDKLKFLLYHHYHKYDNGYYFDNANPNEQEIASKNIPQEKIVKDASGNVIGLKNIKTKRESNTIYNITGYVDKDIENNLFKYRGV